MPRRQIPRSLREMSISNIADNMNKVWSSDYREQYGSNQLRYIIGPFDCLDGDSVSRILERICARRKMTRLYLQLLIVPNISVLDLKMCNSLVNDALINVIITRCVKLTNLNLANCNRVSSQKLAAIVLQFCKTLQTLDVSHTNFDDNTAKVVGQNCKVLSVLNISGSSRLSLAGIQSLFCIDSKQSNTKLTMFSKTVKILHMWYCEADVNLVAKVLKSWSPQILRLSVDHFWKAIAIICEQSDSPLPLNLHGSKDMYLDTLSLLTNKSLPLMLQTVQNLKHLTLFTTSSTHCDELFYVLSILKSLTTFTVYWRLPFHFLKYVGACCSYITKLDIQVSDIEEWSQHH
uniref:uncharacterized protein LOC104265463 n=1 Tax=Ciona intestinalis TaxID=7719 RepID=UPI00052123D8|nr:uncharacterized protein LOC104265463 [Ciona intestinalis]|eukprot:XP_009857812.1 uncharacterized protein LOC104265463 [Ciona intestinalis]